MDLFRDREKKDRRKLTQDKAKVILWEQKRRRKQPRKKTCKGQKRRVQKIILPPLLQSKLSTHYNNRQYHL